MESAGLSGFKIDDHRYGNGDTHAIGIQGGSWNVIEHNIIDGAGGSGITMYQGPDNRDGQPPQDMHDNTVRFNVVANVFTTKSDPSASGASNQRGIEICDSHYVGPGTSYNNSVYYNIVSNVSGDGLRSKAHAPGTGHGEYQWRWLNNVVIDCGVGFSTINECVGPNQRDCRKHEQVANNVFLRSKAAHHDGWDPTGLISHRENDWQHNLFYPDGASMFCFGLCSNGRIPCHNCTNFAKFQRDEPHPTHSLIDAPQFVNDTALPEGLHPQLGSPLLNGGVDVGLGSDWAGVRLTGNELPSVGIFQDAASSMAIHFAPNVGAGTPRRNISWWWDTPNSADDPAVEATLSFCKTHRHIVSTLIMRCNVLTCCRTGTGECGNAVNHSIPKRPGSCTNNRGCGGVVTGTVSPACKKMIPALAAMGIRSELWLGEDDAISSARYLFAHPEETAADLLSIAKDNPGLVGFNLDLETSAEATEHDMQAFAAFLAIVTRKLNAAPAGPIRFSADVSCMAQDSTTPSRLCTNCSRLASSGVNRLMNMRTYNAGDYAGWARQALLPAVKTVPRDVLGVGLGCWVDGRTNSTWNVQPQSAKQRICLLRNLSVQEIDMFILVQGKPASSSGYPVTFPEEFWIPQLELFAADVPCEAAIPPAPSCPKASVGPATSWVYGRDPGCCTSQSRRGINAHCNVICAQAECAAAKMVWRPENFSVHPYECCHT